MILDLDLTNLPPLLTTTLHSAYGDTIAPEVTFLLAGDDPASLDAWADAIRATSRDETVGQRDHDGTWYVVTTAEADIDGLHIEVNQVRTIPAPETTAVEASR